MNSKPQCHTWALEISYKTHKFTETGSSTVRQTAQLRKSNIPACFLYNAEVWEKEIVTSVRIWQRGGELIVAKWESKELRKIFLKQMRVKKGLQVQDRETNEVALAKVQVFMSEITIPVWVLRIAWNFGKNSSFAQKTCRTEATAGPSQPSPWCYLQRLHGGVRAAHAGGVFVRRNRAGSGGSDGRART